MKKLILTAALGVLAAAAGAQNAQTVETVRIPRSQGLIE